MAAAAGGLIGGAMASQGLSDVASSAMSAYMANRENNQSWQRQKAIMKSRYTWMVGDLKRAGLNPILAVSGGSPPGGSPPTTPGIQGRPSDLASSAREAQELGLRGQVVKEQLNNIQADTRTKEAQAFLVQQQGRSAKAVADKEEVTKIPYDFVNQLIDAVKDGKGGAFLSGLINSGKSAAGEFQGEMTGGPSREERERRLDQIERLKRTKAGGSPWSGWYYREDY